jgi:hypothetical protein
MTRPNGPWQSLAVAAVACGGATACGTVHGWVVAEYRTLGDLFALATLFSLFLMFFGAVVTASRESPHPRQADILCWAGLAYGIVLCLGDPFLGARGRVALAAVNLLLVPFPPIAWLLVWSRSWAGAAGVVLFLFVGCGQAAYRLSGGDEYGFLVRYLY